MKKYVKEITSLLTLVTVGVTGGSVCSAKNSDTKQLDPDITVVIDEPVRLQASTDTSDNASPVSKPVFTPTIGTEIYSITTTSVPRPVFTPTIGTDIYPTTTTSVPDTTIPPLMGTFINTTTSSLPQTDTTPVTTLKIADPVRGRGDINGDKKTDLSDLLSLSMYLLKDIELDQSQLIEADITKDNEVDIADLPALQMVIMTPEKSTDPPQVNQEYSVMNIINGPNKTEYKIGEDLDFSGIAISAYGCTYQGLCWDIFSHAVSPVNDRFITINSSEFNNQIPGSYRIFLRYITNNINCSTYYTVTVK